jgi:NADH-quinone oxidoreductase subunit N
MSFNRSDLIALLPLIALAATAVLVMLLTAFHGKPRAALWLTLLGLIVTCATLPLAAKVGPLGVTPLFIVDEYALLFMVLILAATFAIAVLCYGYFGGRESAHQSVYILLLLGALGGVVLVVSSHFASFFLGLELLSVSLFALIAYSRHAEHGIEAGIKYLVLAGFSSSFLAFGMALIYAGLGTMQFDEIGAIVAASAHGPDRYLLAGLALILVGIGFKLGVVPFHMWTPDVYEGATAPVAAFVATVSKGAALALLLRYLIVAGGHRSASIGAALAAIAIASMLAGNLLALLQNNVKRILAYSSIAQLGYLLVAFLALGTLAVEAVVYYLAAYFVTMIGAFGVVAVLSERSADRDNDDLANYSGLFWTRPWLAAVFTAMLLSLAGIPLTMGFIGKFYLVAAGIDASLWLLVVVLVIGSVIGLFYFLRVIAVMCTLPDESRVRSPLSAMPISIESSLVLASLTVLLVVLGIYPAPLIRVLHGALAGFG